MSASDRWGMPLMAVFWSQRDKQMSLPHSFLNASYCFTRSSCCLLQPSLSLPPASAIIFLYASVSGRTESWGLKLLCYLLCLQGSDTEEKESQSSVTSSPNDKQIDPALWLWQSKQG